jgi:hypothetical protein
LTDVPSFFELTRDAVVNGFCRYALGCANGD